MSKLSGLRKKDITNDKDIHTNEEKVDTFINSAALKAIDEPKIDQYKLAKRDQSFLLKLNRYEIDLINQVFENSKYRSKLELARSILIPALEKQIINPE